MVLRNVGTLRHSYTTLLHFEDGGSIILQNNGILTRQHAASQPIEDGGSTGV